MFEQKPYFVEHKEMFPPGRFRRKASATLLALEGCGVVVQPDVLEEGGP